MSLGDKIKKIFGIQLVNDEIWDDFTDTLIESDIGPAYAMHLTVEVKKALRGKRCSVEEIRNTLSSLIADDIKTATLPVDQAKLTVLMLLGVNGVGKTSTAAKLADHFAGKQGKDKVILAAADTFRAAAIDQLKIHGDRLQIKVIAQAHGSDAGAVIYDALQSAIASRAELLIADTAGRLHNKQNLVRELEKINKIISAQEKVTHYRKLLVVDATTGSNALRQAEIFSESVKLDGIIMTKFDSSAKGGMLATICRQLKLPVFFICNGENYGNIQQLNPAQYVNDLLDM
ncbi:MAG: signal recognition particle-docking protein FtsY [Spirochaetes bacterium]|nr:signal recognition particle-docking protein FtsY [Spirochaetota bacterium]